MEWKELYRPTVGKLIVPAALFIFQVYWIISHWGGYFMCKVDCGTNITYAISSILISLIFIILLVYPIVCWVYAFVNWTLNKIKK